MLAKFLARLRKPESANQVPLLTIKEFNWDDFDRILNDLDQQVGKSKNLSENKPIRIMATGGFVCVTSLGNRTVTRDLDYFLDPGLSQKVMAKLTIANDKTSRRLGIEPFWFSSSISVLVLGDSRNDLFRATLEQNVILWKSTNLIIYACKWEWALTMKLRRYVEQGKEMDILDAVFVLHKIVERADRPITKDEIRAWYPTLWVHFSDSLLGLLEGLYVEAFGGVGIVG